jgi:SnoaL-like domain
MDSREPVRDSTAWRLAVSYIDAWNKRDRAAWLDLLHPELEFRPTALVGPGIVYRGIDGAARYFDELIASERAEQAEIVGLRRVAQDRFLIELELLIDGGSVATACVISQVRDGKFVDTAGYLSDAPSLAFAGHIPDEAPVIERPIPESTN